MKSAMRGSELLNRQLVFYSTPNLKLVISKALEDIGNEKVYHKKTYERINKTWSPL
jgi:hypothetical protein